MICDLFPFGTLRDLQFVVTLAFDGDGIWLSRHRQRSTWETQGGHIEADETPVQAAMRELYEESGATDFSLRPLCDYSVSQDEGDPSPSNGAVFVALLRHMDAMPPSEMAEVRHFERLPDAASLTYPDVTPVLYARAVSSRKAAL